MKLNGLRTSAIAAALFAAVLVNSPAMASAGPDPAFAALQNVEAQSLTAAEMQAIAGELNAEDIAAALTLLAAKYAAIPRLSAFFSALAAYALANADTIDARLKRIGLYTAP